MQTASQDPSAAQPGGLFNALDSAWLTNGLPVKVARQHRNFRASRSLVQLGVFGGGLF